MRSTLQPIPRSSFAQRAVVSADVGQAPAPDEEEKLRGPDRRSRFRMGANGRILGC
jgi:hypothetical protein